MKKRFGKKTYTCRKSSKRAYHCTMLPKKKVRRGGKRKKARTVAQKRADWERRLRAGYKRHEKNPLLIGPAY
jgi:hypothetical protein